MTEFEPAEREEEINITPLTQVRDALHEEDLEEVSEIVNELAPAEIARMLESLPPTEREQVWEAVDSEYGGDVLAHLSESVLEDIVDDMSHEELVQTAGSMDEDDLVDFLQDIPDDVALKLMASFDEAQRERLTQILEYDEDSAGGMMNTDPISVRPETLVQTVIRYLRRMDTLPDVTNKIFVVDREGHLQGEVILTHLLTADNNLSMREVMNTDFVALDVNMPGQQVARLFREHDLVSAAVLNENEQLVGRVTVDDVVDYIQEESERLLMQTAGMDEEVDTFAPIHKAAISRSVWLGVNLITALAAASVINAFGDTIEKVVALAALSPVVASMGGIAGSQSLTIIIRGIALGQIEGANAWSLLLRELLISIIGGLVWGLVTAAIAIVWFGQANLALIVFVAIFVNLLFAALSGVIIPLILNKLKIDPALAGSVILTTVTDVVGFLVLLGLASIFL
ncbi:magnesium transporter [Suttonella ornithocola]|uniref:Magnesium transporter MgtE n=1 Tax=Suttonella ornithocola TaxID=279832 RepID=A0A380MPL4_9GAMM|nr:magnesium transporter [Suttonella ornithocola]SUO94559.1 Magnesium transporter mgtE [Suttonella ornithocola]